MEGGLEEPRVRESMYKAICRKLRRAAVVVFVGGVARGGEQLVLSEAGAI